MKDLLPSILKDRCKDTTKGAQNKIKVIFSLVVSVFCRIFASSLQKFLDNQKATIDDNQKRNTIP